MGLFRVRKPESQPSAPEQVSPIPITQFDLSKRYDVYYMEASHDRVYENVLFVGIRTFDRLSEYSSGLINGYLEIESTDGSRCLLPSYGIRMICESGTQPTFRILRHRRNC
ncbi:unnamed protein product [Gemmata massiliana]|uniref:Uncharacterized protein n=1 Tax=Gemmata massiliana TaxID=1210884 RepID=A0A6P2CUR2_9BACT|nr:unnamed protein product [Gemmata massiliana]